MNKATLFPILALCLAACNRNEPSHHASTTEDPRAGLDFLTVDAVANLVSAKEAIPVDANGPETRARFGIVLGVRLLNDYRTIQPGELPIDKRSKLVFYCGGPACTAAPTAAQAAIKAGYSDVHVMRDGIKGWVAAGKQVSKPET